MHRPIAIIAVCTLAVAACGDDNGGDDGGGSESAAACDAIVAVDQAFMVDEDPAAGIAALEDFVAAAPDDVAGEVEPVIPLLREDVEAALESDELTAAEAAADEYALDSCGDTRLDVEALDYAFAGMPTELEAGRIAVNVTNESQTGEFHELLVLRKDDTVSETAHDTLASALGGPISVDSTLAALEPFTLVGGGLVEPEGGDAQDVFVIDIEPGAYIVTCLLPADSPELLEPYFAGEAVEGQRHFDHGMFVEFTVT